jgi:signal transduction histidine kinase
LRNAGVRVVYTSAATKLPLLTTAQQVLQLSREEADRGYPVHLRGVITCVWPDDPRNHVLQDHTRGVFLLQSNMTAAARAQFGEFWDVEGVTRGGAFSPMISVQSMERIGDGRLPDPAHPEWDQLVNGSLDNQYVEIEGVVLEVKTNTLVFLAHSGRMIVTAFGESPPGLEQFENKLVRLRGCLQAVWDGLTHQVKVGEIRMGNLAINVERAYAADPFAVPERQVPELRLYDVQANAFRRVKLAGQFLQQRAGEAFMVSGTNGLRFISNQTLDLRPGDLIEVAGIPDLRGVAPVLREAVARKVGVQVLPMPKELMPDNFLMPDNDSRRVALEGTLADVIPGRDETVLEIRAWSRAIVARVRLPAAAPDWQPGSRVRVVGVYIWHPQAADGGLAGDAFELLVRSPLDVEVLSRPPWWTFKRLLLALGLLAGGLALAAGWIVLLRRQVERRTAQLERANRRREQAEQARALEEERLRIARDLHDDLGSSLTEITMLGGMGLAEKETARGDVIAQIVKKARDSVNALDVIVWAVNPRENTLQSLADYLASFADEFLTASGVACRMTMPVSFPDVVLEGRVRHDLFLAAKEALNNAVRHARATEVDLGMALEQGGLVITVKDNGCGFDPATKGSAHGLGNLRGRLEKLGGECQIDAAPGRGTTVTLKLKTVPPG